MDPLLLVVLFVAVGYIALILVVSGQFWWQFFFELSPEQRRAKIKGYFGNHEHY